MKNTKLKLPTPKQYYNTSVNVRLTIQQKIIITDMANQAGVSASEIMRSLTLQAINQLKHGDMDGKA